MLRTIFSCESLLDTKRDETREAYVTLFVAQALALKNNKRTTKGNNIGGFRRLLKWKRGLAFCSFSIVNAFRKSYIISDEGNLET